jgi:D-alanine transaminase
MTAEPLANLDGVLLPLSEAKVPALDRGFLFGDAVYEVLRVYGGRPWLADEHFARLARSLDAVRIQGIDLARLRRRMDETLAAAGAAEAIVYIQVTRGAAPRSHPFPKGARPLELLYVQPFADPYVAARRDGAAVVLRPDLRWGRCDVKSTNLLANVLAMQEAREAGCVEALLVRADGGVSEATHSSVFGVAGGALLTAPEGPEILPGITRRWLLDLAGRAGVPVRQRMLRRDELAGLDELFLSGTTAEVIPIVKVDDFAVGAGSPGPVTRRLQAAYAAAVAAFRSGATSP